MSVNIQTIVCLCGDIQEGAMNNGKARPDWARLDTSFRRNPKIDALTVRPSGWQAIVMWLDGITYATHHLTDGHIPLHWPRSNGYAPSAVALLIEVDLWWQIRELGMDGTDPGPVTGYLINDYDAYQISRANWTEEGQKRHEASMKAHAARWGRSNGRAPCIACDLACGIACDLACGIACDLACGIALQQNRTEHLSSKEI